jgi:thiol-disulfide isomerase/thioredoxin
MQRALDIMLERDGRRRHPLKPRKTEVMAISKLAIWLILLACGQLNPCALVFGKDVPDSDRVTLRIRLIDRKGAPIQGAEVGTRIVRSESTMEGGHIKDSGWQLSRKSKPSSKEGIVEFTAEREGIDRSLIVARHPDLKLMGISKPQVSWHDKPGRIVLEPECQVTLQPVCPEIEKRKGPITGAVVYASIGNTSWMTLVKDDGKFGFPAPAGSFHLKTYSPNTHTANISFSVARGQRDLNLGPVPLKATKLTLLEGHAAPEFQGISGWVNSRPLKRADLKGKVVPLEFWGYWCGPCIAYGIPEAIKLHDEFQKEGLVVIGVHVPIRIEQVDTPDKLEAKVSKIRERYWKGRHLPFPIAIARSQPTKYRDDMDGEALCQMSADYGVTGYPITILIDRQGNVVGQFAWCSKAQRDLLKRLLAER